MGFWATKPKHIGRAVQKMLHPAFSGHIMHQLIERVNLKHPICFPEAGLTYFEQPQEKRSPQIDVWWHAVAYNLDFQFGDRRVVGRYCSHSRIFPLQRYSQQRLPAQIKCTQGNGCVIHAGRPLESRHDRAEVQGATKVVPCQKIREEMLCKYS